MDKDLRDKINKDIIYVNNIIRDISQEMMFEKNATQEQINYSLSFLLSFLMSIHRTTLKYIIKLKNEFGVKYPTPNGYEIMKDYVDVVDKLYKSVGGPGGPEVDKLEMG